MKFDIMKHYYYYNQVQVINYKTVLFSITQNWRVKRVPGMQKLLDGSKTYWNAHFDFSCGPNIALYPHGGCVICAHGLVSLNSVQKFSDFRWVYFSVGGWDSILGYRRMRK